jgi:hypothetical protein
MISPEEKKTLLLNRYQSGCKYLKNIETDYPVAQGICQVDNTFYTSNDLHHITAVETILCLNQVSYIALSVWFEDGVMGFSIPFEQFYQIIAHEDLYIVQQETQFKQNIQKGSFPVVVEIMNHKKSGRIIYLDMAYNLGKEKKFSGTMKVCVKL